MGYTGNTLGTLETPRTPLETPGMLETPGTLEIPGKTIETMKESEQGWYNCHEN